MSNLTFKTLGTGKEVSLLEEIKNFVETSENGKIYVSTDSQVKGANVKFATVVVLHNVDKSKTGKGARVFYTTLKEVRKLFGKSSGKDFAKLYKETELSVNVANYIRDNLNIKVDYIDLDYNADPVYFSNTVLLNALGYVKGLGYTPRGKPALASYAADKLAKS